MPTSTQPPRPGRHRTGSRRLVFALATALAILTGQELIFRIIFVLPEVEGFNRIRYQLKADSLPEAAASIKQGLAYESLRFQSDLDGFSEIHHLNVYGFRGPDFSIDPPASTRRILLVGDSIVEGQGAPESATIGTVLERQLRADGDRAEVLNLGVVAGTIDRATRIVRDAVPLLRPTDVVFVIYANDLPAQTFPRELLTEGPTFPRNVTPWWTPRAMELLRRASRGEPIVRRWPHRVMPFFPSVPNPTNPWTQRLVRPEGLDVPLYESMRAGRINPWLRDQAEALPGMLEHDFAQGGMPTLYLQRVADICRLANANLLVVYVPFYAVTSPRYAPTLMRLGIPPKTAEALSVDPVYRRQNVMLHNVCQAMKLLLCDATEPLVQAEAAGVPQFWEYDSHPRPVGYETIARAIHEEWRRSFRGQGSSR